MGYYSDKSSGRGILYLKTREEEPFCAHQYRVKVYSAFHDLPLRTTGRLQVTLTSNGGLTEKFSLTEKDDTELFAGEVISQIIVPHPALGFPTNITLLYTEYKGWLTRGLTTWSINKFVMSDSYGKTYSICKHMILQSGKKVELELKPGDCKAPLESEEVDFDEMNSQTESLMQNSAVTTSTEISVRTEISELSVIPKNIDPRPLIHKQVFVRSTPIKELNSSATELNTDTSTDFNTAIVDDQLIRESNKRSFEVPALSKSTLNFTDNSKNETDEKTTLVQLFPFRIASMFEKAERYTRQTIFYLTEQFPTFFKKNIDLYDDNETNIIEDSKFLVDTYDTVKPEKQLEKRAFRALSTDYNRNNIKGKDYIGQYKNLSGVQSVFVDESRTDVNKIDLPTYRPTRKKPKYIPLERG